jgi:hypothetical protein
MSMGIYGMINEGENPNFLEKLHWQSRMEFPGIEHQYPYSDARDQPALCHSSPEVSTNENGLEYTF